MTNAKTLLCSRAMSQKDLLEPFSFRNGVKARNRIFLAPMTNLQSHDDGTLSDDELHWLDTRARGGFGVIETCARHVTAEGQGVARRTRYIRR